MVPVAVEKVTVAVGVDAVKVSTIPFITNR
jgi:hypothetical protein